MMNLKRNTKTLKKLTSSEVSSRFKKSGFSLIELLVAMVISGIVLVSVLTSFWLFIQTHQKAELNRELQRETRFALSRIADKTRNYAIDYEQYKGGGDCPPSINQNHKLCLEGYNVEFKNDNLWLNDQPLLSPDKFIINTARFGFSPDKDPRKNLGDIHLQIQPKVTISFNVESRKVSTIKFDIQTTLSSRKY